MTNFASVVVDIRYFADILAEISKIFIYAPRCTSIIALPVARKGLPNILGISLSYSMSRMMKYAGKINLSTFTRTSSIKPPPGCFNNLSANWSVTVVRQASPNPSRLNMDNGMRFILSPKSHKALSKMEFPDGIRMVKLPGSFSFCGSFLYRMALHSSVRCTVSKSDNLLFFESISFMNFT